MTLTFADDLDPWQPRASQAGLTKSTSSRVSPEYFFRVYTRTREIFRRVAHTHTREWDVVRYSQHRITKGIREYYSYSQFCRSRYP